MGCQVLSYSKRLVNQVICLANDNDINVYYTDTDSIHLPENGVDKLGDLFREKCGRELIGKQLGMFHTDFDLNIGGEKMKDVRSLGLITLGKKSYIDKLEGTDKEGNTQCGYHIRLKGISVGAIDDHVLKVQKTSPQYNEWQMFERLHKGDAITFDLSVNNKCRFQKSNGHAYSTFV